ncbi:MAG: hypothetical protein PHP74_00605 [Candidatus Gracilibacteria bacterium]|nr:hypothetical protein [Candidatus Gracilibacteria bacterium]
MDLISQKITGDQMFLAIFFVASLLVSFLFGYTVFRYWEIDVCKEPMRFATFDERIYK